MTTISPIRSALMATVIRSSRPSISAANKVRNARSVSSLSRARHLTACFDRSHHFSQQKRMLSEEAATKKAEETAAEPSQELTFSTPRVKELYERMSKLSKDEVAIVGQLILDNCGLKIEPDEFYYHGIGRSGGGGKGGAGAVEEAVAEVAAKKDSFDVKLTGFDEKSKIKVIKEVRAITGLGLKEAKEMVEGAPKVIQKDMKEEAANELKQKLEEVGASIELV